MNSFLHLKSFAFCLMSLFIVACKPLKPLEFRSVSDFKIENALVSPQVTANLNFFNPNSVGGTIKKFQLDVSLQQAPLTTVSLTNQRMPANSNFSLPLNVSIPYSQLIKFVPLGIASLQGGKDIPVDLKGTLTVKKFLFSKKFPIEYHDKISTKDIQIK